MVYLFLWIYTISEKVVLADDTRYNLLIFHMLCYSAVSYLDCFDFTYPILVKLLMQSLAFIGEYNFWNVHNYGLISLCWRSLLWDSLKGHKIQKQPSGDVLSKRCSEHMQHIYRRTPMPECGFNKVALQIDWNHALALAFSCKFAAYFQNTFF